MSFIRYLSLILMLGAFISKSSFSQSSYENAYRAPITLDQQLFTGCGSGNSIIRFVKSGEDYEVESLEYYEIGNMVRDYDYARLTGDPHVWVEKVSISKDKQEHYRANLIGRASANRKSEMKSELHVIQFVKATKTDPAKLIMMNDEGTGEFCTLVHVGSATSSDEAYQFILSHFRKKDDARPNPKIVADKALKKDAAPKADQQPVEDKYEIKDFGRNNPSGVPFAS